MLQKPLCPGHEFVKVQEIVVLEVVEKEILRKNTDVPLLQQPAAIVGDTAANNRYLEALPRSHFTEEQIQRATTLAVQNDFGSGACRRSCRYGAKMGFKELCGRKTSSQCVSTRTNIEEDSVQNSTHDDKIFFRR